MKKSLLALVILTITSLVVTSCSDYTDKEDEDHIAEKQEKPEDSNTQEKEDNQSVYEEDADTNATDHDENPAGEDTYEKMINQTEQEPIDPGEDGKVMQLIDILEIY